MDCGPADKGKLRECEESPRRKAAPNEPLDDRAAAMAEQSRTLRNSIISLAVFFRCVAGLLLGVPGLRTAAERITDASVAWVGAGVVLELLSCAGYVVLFELVFEMLDRRLATRLSLSELAVNSVVSRQRPGRHRAGRLGAAQRGDVGGADRQALGADLRAHERGQPGGSRS